MRKKKKKKNQCMSECKQSESGESGREKTIFPHKNVHRPGTGICQGLRGTKGSYRRLPANEQIEHEVEEDERNDD